MRNAQCGILLVALACSSSRDAERRELAPARAPAGAVTNHVVVISIDGLRPDAIERFGAATLQRLAAEGSHTLEAVTIDPSRTLPSHTSMLTGVPPDVHGITWNSDETDERGVVRVPTVFDVARAGGLRTAGFFSKSKFHHLERPGAFDYVRSPRGLRRQWPGERTLVEAENYLARARPNLLFVHFPDVDMAGHRHGWMTRRYAQAVRHTDSLVARLLAAAERSFGADGYTVIVTADHGGREKGHGGLDPQELTIPWIVWGRGVAAGRTIPLGVRTMDTAATTLWLLGLAVPGDWTGKPVGEAFDTPR